jgi:hypothetical protein
VVSRNRLGMINHTLLTTGALQAAGIERLKTVLMSSPKTDSSTASNSLMLSELLTSVLVFELPFLGSSPSPLEALKTSQEKVKENSCADSGLRYSPPRVLCESGILTAENRLRKFLTTASMLVN